MTMTAEQVGQRVLAKESRRREEHERAVELCRHLIPVLQSELDRTTGSDTIMAYRKGGQITARSFAKGEDWYGVIKDGNEGYFKVSLSRESGYGCLMYRVGTYTTTANNKALNEALRQYPIVPPADTSVAFLYMDCRGANGPTFNSEGFKKKYKQAVENPTDPAKVLELLQELLGKKLPHKIGYQSIQFGGDPKSYQSPIFSATLDHEGRLHIAGNRSGICTIMNRHFTREEWLRDGRAHLAKMAAKLREDRERELDKLKKELADIKKTERLVRPD